MIAPYPHRYHQRNPWVGKINGVHLEEQSLNGSG
jgi:hypothetical protein